MVATPGGILVLDRTYFMKFASFNEEILDLVFSSARRNDVTDP